MKKFIDKYIYVFALIGITLSVILIAVSLYEAPQDPIDTRIVREYFLDRKIEMKGKEALYRNLDRVNKYPKIFKILLNK